MSRGPGADRVGRLVALAAALLTGLLVESPAIAGQDGQRDGSSRPEFQLGRASELQLARPSEPQLERAASLIQPAAQSPGTPDFLFGRPRGWVAFRGSWLVPRAEGDLFAFVNDQLTVDKGDFSTPAMIAEVGFIVSRRVSAAAGLEFSRQTVRSEYRRFIDNRGLPINQATVLEQANVSGSIKLALLEPGRSISRLAFVPRTFTPYVGAGAGVFHYELRQTGDFVDFATLRVFPDNFLSRSWAPSAHVFGGTDVRLWRTLFLDVEARYVWAHGTLGSDFIGFDGIDLDGFRISSGVRVVF